MFDFEKWREWLRVRANELRAAGFDAKWDGNDKHLRSTWISVKTEGRIGDFRCYENKFVDYEILDTETDKWLANEAMIEVDDQNFAEVFQRFREIL
jgi:hypothetical protein